MGLLTIQEEGRITELNKQGFNDANIAEILCINDWEVRRYRKRRGLPKNKRNTEITLEKQRETMRATLKEDTGERMNYRTMSHELRAMQLGWPDYKLGEALIMYILTMNGRYLETPELLDKINTEKRERRWRPETSHRMLVYYVSSLRRKGLVDRLYGTGNSWRKKPRKYKLTEKAYEKARMNREISRISREIWDVII